MKLKKLNKRIQRLVASVAKDTKKLAKIAGELTGEAPATRGQAETENDKAWGGGECEGSGADSK